MAGSQPRPPHPPVAPPPMRSLIVTNMYPSPARPALGPFVRDQVEALRRRDDVEVELFAFDPGPRELLRAAAAAVSRAPLRRRARALRPDGLARAARPARAGGRHAARQRPARAPLVS